MAEGPGKYETECTKARTSTGAHTVIMLVYGGHKGDGFEVQTIDEDFTKNMPTILRDLANQIEGDHEELAKQKPKHTGGPPWFMSLWS